MSCAFDPVPQFSNTSKLKLFNPDWIESGLSIYIQSGLNFFVFMLSQNYYVFATLDCNIVFLEFALGNCVKREISYHFPDLDIALFHLCFHPHFLNMMCSIFPHKKIPAPSSFFSMFSEQKHL